MRLQALDRDHLSAPVPLKGHQNSHLDIAELGAKKLMTVGAALEERPSGPHKLIGLSAGFTR